MAEFDVQGPWQMTQSNSFIPELPAMSRDPVDIIPDLAVIVDPARHVVERVPQEMYIAA
jgi:hypothetical protein